MTIDEFGLGDWWPRPAQAAAGGLDHLPADQWPMLAVRWLAAGFDSQSLRELAQLQSGELPTRHRVDLRDSRRRVGGFAQPFPVQGHRRLRAALDALELMPDVLRSIGFDPAPADEEFTARCQEALDVVQHDLDVTGYGRYQMRARLGRGWPATVFATLPDGSYWGGGEGMSRRENGAWLLVSAAAAVSATLKEVHEIEWPVCAVHGGHPASIWDADEPVDLIDEVAWWRCTNTAHPLAAVGQLTAEIARTP